MKRITFLIIGLIVFSSISMGQKPTKEERKAKRAKMAEQRKANQEKRKKLTKFHLLEHEIYKKVDEFTGITVYTSKKTGMGAYDFAEVLTSSVEFADRGIESNLMGVEKNDSITFYLVVIMFSTNKYVHPDKFKIKCDEKIIELNQIDTSKYFNSSREVTNYEKGILGINLGKSELIHLYFSMIRVKISNDLAYKICYSKKVILRANSNLVDDCIIADVKKYNPETQEPIISPEQRRMRYVYDYCELKKELGY